MSFIILFSRSLVNIIACKYTRLHLVSAREIICTMEEIVALDSTKQKQFVKSIKGIKKKLVKKSETPESKNDVVVENKDGKTKKRKIKERGLVYLAHIPHGFYENEMTQYFKQFGMVTNVRVIRSKRTGNSKGYAFVEFKEPTVGQIVAETMNNYLMGKRLLKAAYIPPEKQRQHALRKKWNPTHNPGRDSMLKQKKAYNADKDESQDLKIARKTLSNINKTKEKLRALGINYDFFMPVDVPEQLVSSVNVNQEKGKPKKDKVAETKIQTKKEQKNVVKTETKTISKGAEKAAPKKESKMNIKDSKNKKVVQETKVDTKQQKQKEQKLKEKGVKPAANFIKVQEESGDESDSSLDFDSDEYEKLMENDEDSLGSEEEGSDSDEDGNDEDDSEDENDEQDSEDNEQEELPKMPLVINPNKLKKQEKKEKAVPPQVKRKAVPAAPAPPKKAKFEKQQKSPQFAKKQFKKRK